MEVLTAACRAAGLSVTPLDDTGLVAEGLRRSGLPQDQTTGCLDDRAFFAAATRPRALQRARTLGDLSPWPAEPAPRGLARAASAAALPGASARAAALRRFELHARRSRS